MTMAMNSRKSKLCSPPSLTEKKLIGTMKSSVFTRMQQSSRPVSLYQEKGTRLKLRRKRMLSSIKMEIQGWL